MFFVYHAEDLPLLKQFVSFEKKKWFYIILQYKYYFKMIWQSNKLSSLDFIYKCQL